MEGEILNEYKEEKKMSLFEKPHSFIHFEDGDSIYVRILADTKNDIKCYREHYLENNHRFYKCLAEDDVECPFCKAGVKIQNGMYIQLCTEFNHLYGIWHTASKKVFNDIGYYFQKYGSLSGMIFVIESYCDDNDYIKYDIKPYNEKSDGRTRADFNVREITSYPYGEILQFEAKWEVKKYINSRQFGR